MLRCSDEAHSFQVLAEPRMETGARRFFDMVKPTKNRVELGVKLRGCCSATRGEVGLDQNMDGCSYALIVLLQ